MLTLSRPSRSSYLGNHKRRIYIPNNHCMCSYVKAHNLCHEILIAEHSSFNYFDSMTTTSLLSILNLRNFVTGSA